MLSIFLNFWEIVRKNRPGLAKVKHWVWHWYYTFRHLYFVYCRRNNRKHQLYSTLSKTYNQSINSFIIYMKTTKEILDFCNDFIYYDPYNFEKLNELNHVRDCIINFSSECNSENEYNCVRVSGVIVDTLLTVIDRNIEKIGGETNIFRIVILQLFCLG